MALLTDQLATVTSNNGTTIVCSVADGISGDGTLPTAISITWADPRLVVGKQFRIRIEERN
jgi:hypothetical protein